MIKRHRHELPMIPTANLVDIAILLIIFFMACSHFISSSTPITPPKAQDLIKVTEPLAVVSIDETGKVYMQGREVAGAGDIEGSVTELVRDKKTDEERMVMFKCDAKVSREIFQPVLDAIVRAGGLILAVGENVEK